MFLCSAAPEFCMDKYQDTLVLKQGQSTAIEIPFIGHPQPKVKWDKDKIAIMTSKRVVVDVIRNMTSLCIGHVQLDDAGTYSCTLQNPHGKTSISIKLQVLGQFAYCL